ncbi:MAG: RiPP maturation radical SAM C-methyltransferase [Deltaproteobacteria bacterium]
MANFRLALISMPWPLANRPSIQLGALKSFIESKAAEVKIDCYHPYLEVGNLLGLKTYNDIAERTWVAESVYAYLLNPERRPEITALVSKECRAKTKGDLPNLENISNQIQRLHQKKYRNLAWSSYDLIGFSICLSQLTSSLFMIREIRKHHPHCPIVVGGSSCAGELGYSLLANSPEIDFVVSGEGELPLLTLLNRIKNDDFKGDDSTGLLWRDKLGKITGGGLKQLPNLKELPVPDYSDYFAQLRSQSRLSNLIPNLPVETSRGCWWHRVKSGSVDRACKFCNLNLQWRGYRSKEAIQVAREMEKLASKHSCLKFSFADNILDSRKLQGLFKSISDLERSFEIFTELRASVSRDDLIQMRRAGVNQVQIGVEALSTNLLDKINKGTTAIQNIELMKHCEELDIRHSSNLILGFTTSDGRDVEETLNSLLFVLPYQPLRKVRFWLGQNSPVDLHPEQFGILRVANHPNYKKLLPDSLADSLCLMIKTYTGDRTRQKKLWMPVAKVLDSWQQQYHSLRKDHFPAPLLGYRDGRDFLLVRRRSENYQMETFRLKGYSRGIYRFCGTRRTLAQILHEFPSVSLEKLKSFISHMVDKGLMFREGDQVLSLAVNEEKHKVLCGAE